ncbi:MAG: methylated-DNA--[protein]-cysteine S-methyltransferase [Phycisphaerae bacterium]|jgi:methylated-DNA-[protein]-cysteine S-methyltransferase|nr:methylated-DNA--[protein]-cysteine S-methyltransferase [Phycisphaerae bacterium]
MASAKSKDQHYAVWTTAWGPVGAVSGKNGLTRVVLPHYTMQDLRELLAWEHKGAELNEKPFEDFIELSRAYFNGEQADFSDLVCDLPSETKFSGKVLRACREIPYGKTMSYSQISLAIKAEDSARAVAGALSRNPLPLIVPCHRVTYADGRPGGFSAPGGVNLKAKMLTLEFSEA